MRHFVEHCLGIEWPIEIAHAGVITPDDQVRGTHVLAEYSMQQRLARSGIQHVESVAVHHDGVFGK